MKIIKCSKKSGVASIVAYLLLLTGCNMGASTQSGSVDSSNKANVKSNTQSQNRSLPTADIFSESYNILPKDANYKLKNVTTCTSSNSYCVTSTDRLGATYALGMDQKNHWILPHVGNRVTVKFNDPSAAANFRISDIHVDLKGDADVVGKLSYVDFSNCESLINKGVSAGDSCDIDYLYQGELFNSTVAQQLHILFTNSNYETLDIPITIANMYFTNQNTDILQTLQDDIVFNAPILSPTDNLIELSTDINPVFMLQNIGTETLAGDGVNPTIKPFITSAFQSLFGVVSYNELNYSDIGVGDLPVNEVTKLPFQFLPPKDQDNDYISTHGVLIYQYKVNSAGHLVNANLVKQFIYSSGFMSTTDDVKLNSAGGNFSLEKLNVNLAANENLEQNLISYNPKLSNFKLSLEYDPTISLFDSVVSDMSVLSIGDYPSGLSSEQVLANYSLDYDPSCFESNSYNITESSAEDAPTLCKVNVKYNGNPYYDIGYKKPVSGIIIATYKSPIGGGYGFKQVLGKIDFSLDETPDGSYMDSCQDIKMNNGILSGQCKNYAGSYIPTSLNYLSCLKSNKLNITNTDGILSCSN